MKTLFTESELENIIQSFNIELPSCVRELFNLVLKEGFTLTIVGGSVRDYLLTQNMGRDFDVELQFRSKLSDLEWSQKRESLVTGLINLNYKVSELLYGVIRISLQDNFEVEFAPARVEIFKVGDKGHKNFDAKFLSREEYQKTFRRRDFTVNAIGIEFTSEDLKLIDPFDGISDLENKVLRECGPEFFFDPVRFLRMIRFKNKLDFEISSDLYSNIKNFNLEKVSVFYFLKEAFKYDFKLFVAELSEVYHLNKLHFGDDLHFILFEFEKMNFKEVISLDDLICHIFLNEDLENEVALKIISILSYSKKKVKKLIEFKTTLDSSSVDISLTQTPSFLHFLKKCKQ